MRSTTNTSHTVCPASSSLPPNGCETFRARATLLSCNPALLAVTFLGLLLAGSLFLGQSRALACPFCESVQQTLRQQSEMMDAVVIATSLDGELTRNLSTGEVKMKVETVLKGGELVKVGETVEAIYYGKVEVGRRFLLSGVDPTNLQWSCLPVNERVEKYIVDATKVEDDDVARLKYYKNYLEDKDPLISRDAYDEFASAPYDVIKKIGPEMDRKQLIDWTKDPDLGADRKRLFFTMLGVCGNKDDLPMLEAMLRNPAKSVTGGLDALIACYLTLAGEEGLPLIDELFIANKKAPFPQSYAAIMAIRFHGTEGGVIARSALVESLHKVLDRTELADMVIPDLARWNDWSQIERLSRLFKEAEKDKNWLRVPVINYLRACPLEEAEQAITELEKIDPDAVRRAKAFFPIPVPVRKKSTESSSTSHAPVNWKTGEKYATVAGVEKVQGLAAIAAVPNLKIPVVSGANLWDLGYVLAMALATIVLGQFLLLTGGSPTGKVATIAE